MTITTVTNAVQYSGNDVTTEFAFNYRTYDADDIFVFLTDSNGDTVLKTKTTHYTISVASDYSSATVTMLTPPATGETLSLVRRTARKQQKDFSADTSIKLAQIEEALDILTVQTQDAQYELNKCVKINLAAVSDDVANGLDLTADYYIKVNATADGFELVDNPGSWVSGAGAPSGSTGALGNMYLNTSTGDIYGPKTAGGWGSIVVNLQGATGDAGADGAFTTGNPSLTAPAKDDTMGVFDTSDSDNPKNITLEDFFKVIDGLTAEASIDAANDYVAVYDASAGAIRKALVGNLSGGGDMTAAVYDPNTVAGDAFDMDNMVDGASKVAMTTGERSKLSGIESGATADQSNAEIETAYNAQVAAASQAEMEAGTVTDIRRMTPERVAQAIAALAPGTLEYITSVELSTDSSVDFTEFDSSIYDAYLFVFQDVELSLDDDGIWIRTSTDGGSSFDSGGSDYRYSSMLYRTDNTYGDYYANADSVIVMTWSTGTYGQGNAAGEDGASGHMWVYAPHRAKQTKFWWGVSYHTASGHFIHGTGGGYRDSSADVDAIRFIPSAGTLESGKISMYGLRKA